MKLKLKVFTDDVNDRTDLGTRYRFAVLDLDRHGDYPANFVCLLPTQFSIERKSKSLFFKAFGARSIEQARLLLTEALKSESNHEVKAEIKRRLTLLNSEKVRKIECAGYAKMVEPKRIRGSKQNLCDKCVKRKYGPKDNKQSQSKTKKET